MNTFQNSTLKKFQKCLRVKNYSECTIANYSTYLKNNKKMNIQLTKYVINIS